MSSDRDGDVGHDPARGEPEAERRDEAAATLNDLGQFDPTAGLASAFAGMSELVQRLGEPDRRQQRYEEATKDPEYADDLSRALTHYAQEPDEFGHGDLVQWKPLLRNRQFPAERAPAIVVRRLDPPLTVEQTGEVEALDLEVGYLNSDRAFVIEAYSSRRLMPWSR